MTEATLAYRLGGALDMTSSTLPTGFVSVRLAVVALALHAAFVPVTSAAQSVRVRIGIVGHLAPVAVDSLASQFTIAASRTETFKAASIVMEQLKIPVDMSDAARGVVGVSSFPQMRRVAGSPISRFLNCGVGITGANADNWRVFITAIAFVDAKDSNTTDLRVAMVGGARDVAGASTDPVACGSTGVFEGMFAERVKARLAAGAP